jgi:exodeoxyribonuclease VII small subunit
MTNRPTPITNNPMSDNSPPKPSRKKATPKQESEKVPRKSPTSAPTGEREIGEDEWSTEDLSYRQSLSALELTLAELQSNELEIETMVGLYRRAEAYLKRCESLLDDVEQEVTLWNPIEMEIGP